MSPRSPVMIAAAASLICILPACDAVAPTELAPPDESSVVLDGGRLGAAARPSVTGHGEFIHPFGSNPLTTFSLTAVTHADGRVSGQFELRILVRFHGTVKCVRVHGNMARVGLVATQSDNPNLPPGTEAYVTLVDNGGGAMDPPDRISPPFPGNAQQHCDAGLFAPLVDVLRGNIQVRP